MGACFAFYKKPLPIASRQSNVAMAVAVDVHEHGRTDKKRVFVDSRILSLRYTG